jgi:hypothetical protein
VSAQLEHIRLAKYVLVFSLVIGIALFALPSLATKGSEAPSWLGYLQGLGVFSWLLGLVMIFYNLRLDCPNCKKPFNIRTVNYVNSWNPFRLKCGNCGLMISGENLHDVAVDS